MDATSDLSRAGFLIGDPSRAAMLCSLLGGEVRPASELALLANVSPQTASNHLKLLLDAGFLKVKSSGRCRYYSLNDPSVAAALESLAVAARVVRPARGIARQSAPELVFARTCYDHLAGELGVAVLNRLRQMRCFQENAKDYALTPAGEKFLRGLGVDVACARAKRRRFAYPCLDWSHRLPHLGGALGATLLDWLFASKAVVRRRSSRALRLTDNGQRQFDRLFSIRLTQTGTSIAAGRPE